MGSEDFVRVKNDQLQARACCWPMVRCVSPMWIRWSRLHRHQNTAPCEQRSHLQSVVRMESRWGWQTDHMSYVLSSSNHSSKSPQCIFDTVQSIAGLFFDDM
jgi:hypothetical protein